VSCIDTHYDGLAQGGCSLTGDLCLDVGFGFGFMEVFAFSGLFAATVGLSNAFRQSLVLVNGLGTRFDPVGRFGLSLVNGSAVGSALGLIVTAIRG